MALRLPAWFRKEIKKIVREAMDEWTESCDYLTPNQGEGRYYCSKPDCQGVRFIERISDEELQISPPGR